MGKRPDGLSPAFGSIISPDITETLTLSWQFVQKSSTDRQTKAVVTIYEDTTLLKTITVTGTTTSIDVNSLTDIVWQEETPYRWEVVTYDKDNVASETSGKHLFYYAFVPGVPAITWDSGPEPYEYIGSRQYFDKIRENALLIMEDYVLDTVAEQKLYEKIDENLFRGDVVPARDDFKLVEDLLGFISAKETVAGPQVDELIEDGLNSGDIHKIYTFFDSLLARDPQPIQGIAISLPTIPMYTMTSISATSGGKEATSINVSWDNGSVETRNGQVQILGFSPSEDARYYECEFSYGPSTNPSTRTLYYRQEDFERLNNAFSFDMNMTRLYESGDFSKGRVEFHVVTIDYRGNRSQEKSNVTPIPYNYKAPVGIDHYELQSVTQPLLTKTAPVNATNWYYLSRTGIDKSYVHRYAKNSFEGVVFYRIRAVDKSGLTTDWLYSRGVTYDPLDPPPPPKNFRVDGRGYDYVRLAWDESKTAEGYRVSRFWNTNVHDTGETRTYTYGGQSEGEEANYYVQAYNRAGNSEWVSVKGKTLIRPPVTSPATQILGADCWRTGYTINGGRSWNAAGWRNDKAASQIIQGMWIELVDGYNTDGRWVKAGTTYGNHKSLMYLNKIYWQNLLKGKEILKVELYLKRATSQHGYPKDGRYIQVWTHNYTSRPSGEPNLANGTKIWTNYQRGTGAWMTIPNRFGELLRDGKIAGFALHANFRTVDKDSYTYVRFNEADTKVRITYK